jgi:CxxC-x17-CxxC domain-containing protein
MSNFNRDNRSSAPRARGGFGGRDAGRPSYGPRTSGGTTLYDAVCAECGNDCKVPFMPSGKRPVFCSDCFEKRDTGEDTARAPRRSNFDRPNFSEKRNYNSPAPQSNRTHENDAKNFDQLNAKLDKILKTLNYIINKDSKPEDTKVIAPLAEMVSALEEESEALTSPKAKTKKPRSKKASK